MKESSWHVVKECSDAMSVRVGLPEWLQFYQTHKKQKQSRTKTCNRDYVNCTIVSIVYCCLVIMLCSKEKMSQSKCQMYTKIAYYRWAYSYAVNS